jgi:catechol 2,3-dioxygenase-like lactoylglutathione lyase family enzyme
MTISQITTFLTVHDKDLALAFYRDTLGFTVEGDVDYDGSFWVTLGVPPCSERSGELGGRSPNNLGVDVVLSDPYGGRSQEDGDAMARLMTKGLLNGISFAVADLEETFEKVRASGAEVMQEPMDQPWGARDCAFRDPSGNMIRINQA